MVSSAVRRASCSTRPLPLLLLLALLAVFAAARSTAAASSPRFPRPAFSAIVETERDAFGPELRTDRFFVSPLGIRIDSLRRQRPSSELQVLFRRLDQSPSGWATVTTQADNNCVFDLQSPSWHELLNELLVQFGNEPKLGFPTNLARIPAPERVIDEGSEDAAGRPESGRTFRKRGMGSLPASEWFETTTRSQTPVNSSWSNDVGSVDYCRNEWQGVPRQSIRGCDALQVQAVHGYPRIVRRVHERARSSFDHSWTMRMTFNYSATPPDQSDFDLPADWENACTNVWQGYQVRPGQGRVATPTGDDFVWIRLREPLAPGLGAAQIRLAHGSHVSVIPSSLTFTQENWDVEQKGTLRYVREGAGSVMISGVGGGLDRVQQTSFYVYTCHGRPGWGCDRS